MSTPVTEIDPRFSDPNAAVTEWSETLRAIQSAELFWTCTVRGDGRPHMTPLVAVWLDDALHFCTGAGEQKNLNLGANSRVALATGCNTWDEGLDVVVEGDAVRITGTARLRRLAAAWRAKWDGRWQFEAAGDCFRDQDGPEVLVYAVKPAKVLAFAKGTFSHTRHRF